MISRRKLLALGALFALPAQALPGQARAQLVSPGGTLTLRTEPNPADLDLGGLSRNPRTRLVLANRAFRIEARVPLELRPNTAPFLWNGQLGIGQPTGLYWATQVRARGEGAPREGARRELGIRQGDDESLTVSVAREDLTPLGMRPCILPGGDLLLATRDGALTRRTRRGDIVARGHALGSTRTGALVLADGRIVVGTADRRLVGFDAALRMQFNVALGAGLVLAPAFLAPDRLLVAAGELLVVLDLGGNLLHRTHLRGRAVAPPLIGPDGTVHLVLSGGSHGAVASFRHGSRGLERFELGGRSFDGATLLALDHEGGYRVALPSPGLLCLDRAGSERWLRTLDAPFQGTLLVDDQGTTLAFDGRGRMAIFHADGEPEPLLPLGGLVTTLPAIDGEALWVVTDAPELLLLRPTR